MKTYQQLAAFTLDYNRCIATERYDVSNDINSELTCLERSLSCDLYHVSVDEKSCNDQQIAISGMWYQNDAKGHYTATIRPTFQGFDVSVACDDEKVESLLEESLYKALDREYD